MVGTIDVIVKVTLSDCRWQGYRPTEKEVVRATEQRIAKALCVDGSEVEIEENRFNAIIKKPETCDACGSPNTVGLFYSNEKDIFINLCKMCEKTAHLNGFNKIEFDIQEGS